MSHASPITATVGDGPLTPRLLPMAAVALTVSTDTPSAGPVRPFGLTRTSRLDDAQALSLAGITYDPVRQVNVGADGTPLVAGPGAAFASTSQNTQYDHQWFTDKD